MHHFLSRKKDKKGHKKAYYITFAQHLFALFFLPPVKEEPSSVLLLLLLRFHRNAQQGVSKKVLFFPPLPLPVSVHSKE